jgi:hypothetical protein
MLILHIHFRTYAHETHEKREKFFSVFRVFSGPRNGV